MMIMKPGSIKGANKDSKIYVGRSTTVHNLLFCAHTLHYALVTWVKATRFYWFVLSARSKGQHYVTEGT